MEDHIFKISKDLTRARDLISMAYERLNDIIKVLPKDKSYKIIEEYYEILVQIMTSIMYVDGYKTLSHIFLIEYIGKNYKEFNSNEINLMDQIRKFRHGTVYYGKKISESFLINNEQTIKNIISKLFKIAKEKAR